MIRKKRHCGFLKIFGILSLSLTLTAPYLNDGRAATMKDVLTTFNENDKHGKTSDFSEEQLAQLAEYVLSL